LITVRGVCRYCCVPCLPLPLPAAFGGKSLPLVLRLMPGHRCCCCCWSSLRILRLFVVLSVDAIVVVLRCSRSFRVLLLQFIGVVLVVYDGDRDCCLLLFDGRPCGVAATLQVVYLCICLLPLPGCARSPTCITVAMQGDCYDFNLPTHYTLFILFVVFVWWPIWVVLYRWRWYCCLFMLLVMLSPLLLIHTHCSVVSQVQLHLLQRTFVLRVNLYSVESCCVVVVVDFGVHGTIVSSCLVFCTLLLLQDDSTLVLTLLFISAFSLIYLSRYKFRRCCDAEHLGVRFIYGIVGCCSIRLRCSVCCVPTWVSTFICTFPLPFCPRCISHRIARKTFCCDERCRAGRHCGSWRTFHNWLRWRTSWPVTIFIRWPVFTTGVFPTLTTGGGLPGRYIHGPWAAFLCIPVGPRCSPVGLTGWLSLTALFCISAVVAPLYLAERAPRPTLLCSPALSSVEVILTEVPVGEILFFYIM